MVTLQVDIKSQRSVSNHRGVRTKLITVSTIMNFVCFSIIFADVWNESQVCHKKIII